MDMTQEKFMNMMRAYNETCVAWTGLELGVFQKLGAKPMDAAAAAKAIKCSKRGTEPLLNALVSIGLLEKKKGVFSLAPFSKKYLVEGAPDYIGSAAYHSGHLMRAWVQLPDSVRTGNPAPRPPADSPEAKKRHRHFILAMNDNASRMAALVVKQLDLRGVKRVIDVGGGPGTYAFEFARAIPGGSVAVFDTPPTCAIARERIMQNGFQSQVGTIEGDFMKDNLGTGFDLALMANILHIYSPAENKRLMKKGFKALEPGGQLAVVEFALDPDGTTPVSGAMFSINMLVNTSGGAAYPTADIVEWMKSAGFERVKVLPIDGRAVAIVGRKPKKK